MSTPRVPGRRGRRTHGRSPYVLKTAPSSGALVPLSPCHDPAAEAETPRAHVVDACRTPGLVQAFLRPGRAEAANRAAEERAGLAPAVADHGARGWEPAADVELPERPPDAARDAELEPRDGAARPDDARQLAERLWGVGHVAEEVREREPVQFAVAERQGLRARLDEVELPVRAPPGLGEHARALVDSDDGAAVARGQGTRDEPGSRRDVKHAALGAGIDARDEEAEPYRVLAEGEERRAALVAGAERREELLGVHPRESRLRPNGAGRGRAGGGRLRRGDGRARRGVGHRRAFLPRRSRRRRSAGMAPARRGCAAGE